MPLAEINNTEELETWLQTQSNEMVVAFAARAALRVLPILERARGAEHQGNASQILLPVFRASSVAWAAAKYPEPATRLDIAATAHAAATRAAAAAAAARAADSAADYAARIGAASAAQTARAAARAAETARVAFVARAAAAARAARVAANESHIDAAFAAAHEAENSARYAARTGRAADIADTAAFAVGFAAAATANATYWSAVSFDIKRAEKGAASASDIARFPLWLPDQPDWLQALWMGMRETLLASKQDWDVWTDWYEARLRGKRLNQKLEIACAMIPDEVWDKGPAKVNAEIKELIKKDKSPARQKKKPPHPVVPKTSPTLTVPIENVPSAVSFGWSSKGTIAVVSGAFNWPVFPFGGGEQDHKNRLEACRVLAADIAHLIQSRRWNARSDYSETLDHYAAYLPAQPGEGNFLLADAEVRIIRAMFAAEQDFLPTPLAAKLKVLLEQHIGLRAYYPATEDFYESVRSGHLERPLPLDAVGGFIHGVSDYTPTIFEPNVSQSLESVTQPIPAIALAEAEAQKTDSAHPVPPPDPLGEVDPEKSRQFTLASGVNDLWKVMSEGEKVGKNVEGWSKAIGTLAPYAAPIIEWLRIYLGS